MFDRITGTPPTGADRREQVAAPDAVTAAAGRVLTGTLKASYRPGACSHLQRHGDDVEMVRDSMPFTALSADILRAGRAFRFTMISRMCRDIRRSQCLPAGPPDVSPVNSPSAATAQAFAACPATAAGKLSTPAPPAELGYRRNRGADSVADGPRSDRPGRDHGVMKIASSDQFMMQVSVLARAWSPAPATSVGSPTSSASASVFAEGRGLNGK